jgi:site-specific recombinase XerD
MLRTRGGQGGIEGPVNPHAFRHGFARAYLMDGGDLGSLSDLLGHADLSTTKKWYGIYTISDLQDKHRRHSPISQLFDEEDEGKAGE